jgi:ABC-type phosphate transport system substrate-binding protein
MIKVAMAVLTVLVLASAAFAAYPVNHPCLATQSLDPLTGVVTSVAPEQKATALAGAVASADPAQKVAAFKGSVTSANPVQCPASYFGAQDADRRIDPESGGSGGSGDN